MGPPGFSECFICHKEFGSRSLEFHAPQCLAKWRRDNDALPKSERQKTPSPPPPLPSSPPGDLSSEPPSASSEVEPHHLPASSSESSSSPAAHAPSRRRTRPQSSSFMQRRSHGRPSTATLDKPKILDVKMRHEIDMSEMSRRMMDRLVLKRERTKGSSDYSSDFSSSSSSSSSLSSKSPCDEDATSGESENQVRKKRPSTMRVQRPSMRISVPVIAAPSSHAPLPRRGKTATIRSNLTLVRRRILAQEIIAKDKVKVPEPCLTCGKEQNPERFHSHPRHLSKFKAKDKLLKDKTTKERGSKQVPSNQTISKLIVTKPTPLRYKSRSLDSTSSESLSKENSKQDDSDAKRNAKGKGARSKGKSSSRSAENSPSRKSKSRVPLRDVIERKRSKMKPKKDFVELYESNSIHPKLKSRKKVLTKIPPAGGDDEEDRFDTVSEIVAPSSKPKTNTRSATDRIGTAGLMKMCYICGREFGSRSLGIHEPQCLEKWRRENNTLPSHLKRDEPQRPEKELSKEEWNEYAWKMAQSQLIPCDNCGRTFKPDRLEVHQRGCKPRPGTSAIRVQEKKEVSSPKQSVRPTILCYICGREFGSKSILIHEPQCLTKWKNENDKLADHLQRPAPVKPEAVVDEDGNVDKEAMAQAAWKSHLETLVKCEGCGRTFFPDRLQVHQKSCKNLHN